MLVVSVPVSYWLDLQFDAAEAFAIPSGVEGPPGDANVISYLPMYPMRGGTPLAIARYDGQELVVSAGDFPTTVVYRGSAAGEPSQLMDALAGARDSYLS